MRTLLVLVLFLLAPRDVAACLHAPGGARVRQHEQMGLVVHGGGIEDLILRIEYDVAAGTEKLGWVVPVPSEPTRYAALSPDLFEDVERWVGLEYESEGTAEALVLGALGVQELEPHTVGPYDVQPIRATGETAASAVNEWLVDHGFHAIDDAPLQYYADREWTFLVVGIGSGASGALPDRDELPPLQITFRSERPVYPLKLSTHMGTFGATIFLFSRSRYSNEDFSGALDRGFGVVTEGRYLSPMDRSGGRYLTQIRRGRFRMGRAPSALRPLLRRLGGGTSYLTVLESDGLNVDSERDDVQRRPARWPEDLSVGPPMRLDARRLAPMRD